MKLLFLNGSRGEWGYIKPIIDKCSNFDIEYGICATNMMLMRSHGHLVEELKNQNYNVVDEIMMDLSTDTHYGMAKSLGILFISFVETLKREKPDWLILAGDRGEQLIAATAASYTYTPIAHIQAGERSGNIDGTARHAIGKLAHVHLAANEDAANRLIRSGEQRFRVFNVGAPQLDDMVSSVLPTKQETLQKLGCPVDEPFLLVVNHPNTEETSLVGEHTDHLLNALDEIKMNKIWILPNNDTGHSIIRNKLQEFRKNDTYIFDNLPRDRYLSILKNCECIVGNSSSALLEAPTFQTSAVNIGSRQQNRVRGGNVIETEYIKNDIIRSIQTATSDEFKKSHRNLQNPYGDGMSSIRILEVLSNIEIDKKLLNKKITY